jgi:hypothetical protein
MNLYIQRITVFCLAIVFLAACTSRIVYFTPLETNAIADRPYIDVRTKEGNTIRVFKPRIKGNTLTGQTKDGSKIEIDTNLLKTMSAQINQTNWVLVALYGGLAVMVAVLNAKEAKAPPRPPATSCPFVYTFDGSRYVLEAEPYGGAVTQGLARTEWIPLEKLTAYDNQYRLLMANDLTETEYVDELSLLIADHAPGIRIIPDTTGHMYTVKEAQPPLAACCKSGDSLLLELAARDHLFWEGGKDSIPSSQNETLREEIILTFPKPASALTVKLVVDAWTTIEGSQMAKELLENLGTEASAFFQEVDARGPAFFKFMSCYNREELYVLNLEVETPNGWEKRAWIQGGGPFVQKEKCYQFDVSDIPGDILRIRLNPPLGFWRINSLAVDYSEDEPFAVQELKLFRAQTQDGSDASAALARTDGIYHIMQEGSHPVDLRFLAPPAQPGLVRSILLKASGWYDPHFDISGEPQWETVERILFEPDFALRWAIEHWRQRK